MGWVIDLDGVVWLDKEPIVGAADAVAALRRAGEDVVFVTNNSSAPVAAYEDALERQGIPARGDVITSAAVAAALVSSGETVLVCGGPGVDEALERRGARTVRDGRADAVVVGFHRDFDYDRLRAASDAVLGGARLLATNDDPTYPSPEGPIPGGGAILAAVERATGARATVAGKPYPPAVRVVRARLGDAGTVVGDRPGTDGAFAVALGYRFGLVLSGVTAASDLPVEPAPWVVAPDLAALVAGEHR